ncbi:hypothetical protein MUK71_00630 [Arthrobacter zhangbolii]|uniref:Uncharacterized protein n=1 Tax=Arthrobacter zhangbolii TaxID=2886936 RepID=A0A9X1MAA2_9MICC|nr:hypothetical protein [Arthrobacter zhangbolii]MCC3274161.1 hypothetical protein [Arthrobacter zhangbolii]UON92206.1 hypothetical protein MUK71_00630 [Arthrobacter zhangbolii]
MPEAGPTLVLPLLLLAGVLAAGAAGLDRALRKRDGESLFWTGFIAFLGVLLTAAWGVSTGPGGTAAIGMLLVAGSTAAAAWLAGRHRARVRRLERKQRQAALAAVSGRHREILTRWSAYELDPWLAAEHPQLQDVRSPETRDFIRALKEAERLRPEVAAGADADDSAAYAEAVDRLEESLSRAEQAARGGRAA